MEKRPCGGHTEGVSARKVTPPPLPKRPKLSADSGTRLRTTGVLRLRCTRTSVFFDEVLVFESGQTIVALEGEPLLVYPSLDVMMQKNGIEPHELVAAEIQGE